MNLDFDEWSARNAVLWQLYIDGELSAEAFIIALKKENKKWIPIYVELGYEASGGVHDGTMKNAIAYTEDFINGFADQFLQDLLDGKVTDERGAWRAFLYASEGSRMAYMLGQQQAMRERGAKAWKRILHPESSISGPCQLCIDDSMVVHDMDDAFIALHVNEKCTSQTIDYYPSVPSEVDVMSPFKVSMPVPERFPTNVDTLKKALDVLAPKVKSIVRRVAPRESQTTTPTLETQTPEQMTDEAIEPIIVMIEEERKKRQKR